MNQHRFSSKAAIWDMDGVLVDSANLHFKAWRQLMRQQGRDLSYEDFLPTFGRKNAEILEELLGRKLNADEVEELAEQKERNFRATVGPDLAAFPGVRELLRDLRRQGYRQAVASSAPPENIELVLRTLDLSSCFATVVSAKDVTKGKPDPQVFLIASERLGIAPRHCVVFEDAPAGVQAAKAAGMIAVAITNSHSRAEFQQADLVVDSMEQVSSALLDSLLRH